MKIEIIETTFDKLLKGGTLQNSNVCYNSSNFKQRTLEKEESICGVIIIQTEKTVITAKFTYSCLGDDGSIEMMTGSHYSNYSQLIKESISNYALLKFFDKAKK